VEDNLLKAVLDELNTHLEQEDQTPITEAQLLDAIEIGGFNPSEFDYSDPNSNAPRFWIVDPLDNTLMYAYRRPWSVSVALVDKGKVVLGVMGGFKVVEDAKGNSVNAIFVGSADGAFMLPLDAEGRPIPEQQEALITSSKLQPWESTMIRWIAETESDKRAMGQIMQSVDCNRPPRVVDGQLRYIPIARGEAEIFIQPAPSLSLPHSMKLWEHAAGSCILTAAGGTVTDLKGKPLRFDVSRTLLENVGIIATNGGLHPTIQQLAGWLRAERFFG